MKKSYTITQTKNGFIIERGHVEEYFYDKNKHVAHTLEEVNVIIEEDLEDDDQSEL